MKIGNYKVPRHVKKAIINMHKSGLEENSIYGSMCMKYKVPFNCAKICYYKVLKKAGL